MKELLKNSLLKQVLSYGLIGGCCSLIDVIIFSVLVYLVGMDDLIANIISVLVGMTISFTLNRKITFNVLNHTLVRYVLFFGVGMLGLGLSELILYSLGLLEITPIIAKLISVIVVGVFQFLCNRFISFRTRSAS